MPIGPMGEPLPYNNGAPVGNPMGVQNQNAANIAASAGRAEARGVPPVDPMGVQNQGPSGGNEMAAKQRLMEIAAEAEAIMTQFPHLAQELAGGGQNAQPATPLPGNGQMPVEGNTGGMGGLLAGGPQYG